MNVTSTPVSNPKTPNSSRVSENSTTEPAGGFENLLSFAQVETSPHTSGSKQNQKDETYSDKVKENRKKDDEKKKQLDAMASQSFFNHNRENDTVISDKQFSAIRTDKALAERKSIADAHNSVIQKRSAMRKDNFKATANEAAALNPDDVADEVSFSRQLSDQTADKSHPQSENGASQGKAGHSGKSQHSTPGTIPKPQADMGSFKGQLQSIGKQAIPSQSISAATSGSSLKQTSGVSGNRTSDSASPIGQSSTPAVDKKGSMISAKKAAEPQKPVDVKEVAGKVKMMINKDKSEIVMKLTPEHLGKMEIKLKKDGDQLMAQLKVESIEAKELLEEQLPQLQKNLEDQGVQVKDFNIFVKSDQSDTSGFAFNEHQQPETPHQSGTNRALPEENVQPDSAHPVLGKNSDQNGMNLYA